jgi:hypothetical protein
MRKIKEYELTFQIYKKWYIFGSFFYIRFHTFTSTSKKYRMMTQDFPGGFMHFKPLKILETPKLKFLAFCFRNHSFKHKEVHFLL